MPDQSRISELRKDYKSRVLLEDNVLLDPIEQFKVWFGEALNSLIAEPNAMCLSTVLDNKPVSRIVLLKGIENGGFDFYTNYQSAKGQQVKANPNVALNFVWLELERQVRIEGIVEKMAEKDNDAYFYSRPIESQVGAIVSAQSSVLKNRKELDEAWKTAEAKYKHEKPVRPAHWGGYHVMPNKIEFWQGRSSRLHDRLLYELVNGEWAICRLSP